MKKPESSGVADAKTILIVDDDARLRARLVRAFTDRGFDARGADCFEAARELAEADSPELALVDLRLPGPSGLEIVQMLRGLDETTRIVVLTGYGSIATALEAVRLGAVHYLTKPADLDEIIAAFDRGSMPATTSVAISVPSLERVEWEHIARVLAGCDGNITAAAKLLGIHRRSLQRKLAKHPLGQG